MKILNPIQIENKTAINNSAYYQFLSTLQGNFQIITNTQSRYKESIRSNGQNAVPLYLDAIDKYSYGFSRQLMYYDCYPQNKIRAIPYISRFDSVINNPTLVKYYQFEKNQVGQKFIVFNIVEKLKASKGDPEMKDSLIAFFEQRKNQYIFIDFWGSWCAPCMREMPLYGELINKLKDKNLTFLFFSDHTNESEVIKIKDKYSIKADFIMLTDNQVKILNNTFNFSSYPSHFLVNPNSMVIERNISITIGGTKLNDRTIEMIANHIKNGD